MSNTLIIIPTYNEKENIEAVIRTVFSQKKEFHIVIIDDNSPDGTAAIVSTLIPEFQGKLFLENRAKKIGLGAAYIHGFRWALERTYEYIIEMDADFSHNPKDLIRLYKETEKSETDITIGSRYLKSEISVVNWDITRIFLSYFASKYVRLITRIPVHDTTAGFVCYKRNVLEKINLDEIQFVGYAFQIEMKYKAWKHGFNLKEISIIFTDRVKGKSKMNSSIISEAIFGVLKMRINGLPKQKTS